MNISPFTIYLWQLADKALNGIGLAGVVLSIVFFVASACFVFAYEDYEVPAREAAKKVLKRTAPIAAACNLLWLLIPSSNTIAMMIIIPEIAHSKVVQQDLPDIYNAAVKALKDQLTK